mmetsp:Transcript_11010/g.45891  ORF Transcript_11010/g.45891 Transcript_11010/m.45891 type:complete len:331 (-) Transcript_11010:2028-3020(-)
MSRRGEWGRSVFWFFSSGVSAPNRALSSNLSSSPPCVSRRPDHAAESPAAAAPGQDPRVVVNLEYHRWFFELNPHRHQRDLAPVDVAARVVPQAPVQRDEQAAVRLAYVAVRDELPQDLLEQRRVARDVVAGDVEHVGEKVELGAQGVVDGGEDGEVADDLVERAARHDEALEAAQEREVVEEVHAGHAPRYAPDGVAVERRRPGVVVLGVAAVLGRDDRRRGGGVRDDGDVSAVGERETVVGEWKARIGRERGGDAVAGSGRGERALRRRGQSQAKRPDNEEAERDHGEEHADAPLRRADTLARATEDAGFRDAARVLHVAGVALAHEE